MRNGSWPISRVIGRTFSSFSLNRLHAGVSLQYTYSTNRFGFKTHLPIVLLVTIVAARGEAVATVCVSLDLKPGVDIVRFMSGVSYLKREVVLRIALISQTILL